MLASEAPLACLKRRARGCVVALAWALALPGLAAAMPATDYPFAERLVPVGAPAPAEDRDLAQAIHAYRTRQQPDDVSALKGFLAAHPHSPYTLALATNIGVSDYHYGYFSRAIADYAAAWQAGSGATDLAGRALASHAVTELMKMHARLGHVDEVAALLKETSGRDFTGSSASVRDNTKDALWLMQNKPEAAYRCGPMALEDLLHATGAPASQSQFLDFAPSTSHGTTLADVGKLADQAKLAHSIVFRAAGEKVPVPSVIHWKLNHFAAIMRQQGDRFEVADPTFGGNLWVTRAAIDSEGSGYFIVPGADARPYRTVSADEASGIHGMGTTDTSDPTMLTPDSPCACDGGDDDSGMTRYDFKEMLVSLHLSDTPVGYTPPKGPSAKVQLAYNQREAYQPANPTFFNVGPLWTLNFLAYVQDDPTTPGASVLRFEGGGGEANETGYSNGSFTPDVQDASVLTLSTQSPVTYTRSLKDGGSEVYSVSNGATSYPRLVFLSKIIDPAGNALTLNYDSSFRLTSIVDAAGRSTSFSYGLSATPLLLTKITDPFGRSASLTYNAAGQLASIQDVYGITSSFTYPSANAMTLTTPYGTTNFSFSDNGNQRILQATDPLGYTEHLEFVQGLSQVPFSDPGNLVPSGIVDPFNEYLNARDTFYWDKHQYAVAAGNYNDARIRHWAHLNQGGNASNITSDTLESVKYPLENRIWYNHPGQPTTGVGAGVSGTYEAPSAQARVLDDGTTQLTQVSYNAQGNPISYTDAVGRQTQINYAANGIDIQSVQQGSGTGAVIAAQFPSYSTLHKPLKYTDAAGQSTIFSYNTAGQIHTATDPAGNVTTYAYNTTGDVTSITDPNKKVLISYTYDGFDRVLTRTDSEGWKVTYAYDNLDRVTKETYPDKTTRIFTYRNLDLYQVKDRQNRTTTFTHDANRRLTAVKDAFGNTTAYGYYENGRLSSLTDPNGNVTAFNRDLESRIVSKMYADGHGIGFGYEQATARLLYVADQMNQIKQYSYTPDNQVAGITYFNSVNQTPNVSFTYDPAFPRLTSMSDGSGMTTYQYYPAGSLGALKLAQENPPFSNAVIAYAYDKVGRLASRSVGGDAEQFNYDGLSRLSGHADDLGSFTLGYLGETGQIASQSNGTVGTNWSYDTNTKDRRLTGIANTGGTTYGFGFSAELDLGTLTDSTNSLTWTYGYDTADRLKTATASSGAKYAFAYDAGGNVSSVQRPSGTMTVTSNAVNQITKVNGVTSAYDADGNLLQDYARTYAWDADGRLLSIGISGQTGLSTSFKYDGFGRRIAIDTTSGGITSETRYGWCGAMLCQARTGSDVVARRYLREGENVVSLGQAYYYGLDQVGSVRDAINASAGGVAAHYDYDPYGTQTNTAVATTDARYAGLILNQQSGLYLGAYRAYDPLTGRWISRDRAGESGGDNLYAYAGLDPLNASDPLGYGPFGAAIGAGIGGFLGSAGGAVAGGTLGGGGGTLVAPGVGTIAGGIGGADAGYVAGGLAGAAIGGYLGSAIEDGLGAIFNQNQSSDNADAGPHDQTGQQDQAGTGEQSCDTPASTPVGRRGNPIDVAPGTNDPTNIDGRDYTGHALDRMQGRGVPPSAVEDAIQNGTQSPGNTPGTTVNTGSNGVTAVTGSGGQVITVITK